MVVDDILDAAILGWRLQYTTPTTRGFAACGIECSVSVREREIKQRLYCINAFTKTQSTKKGAESLMKPPREKDDGRLFRAEEFVVFCLL